jgi:DNA-binding NarL/FixJ family response regulator
VSLFAYSNSSAFQSHLGLVLGSNVIFSSALDPPDLQTEQICLLHISSLNQACIEWLRLFANEKYLSIAICSDRPNIEEMLECASLGAKAYCNSYMQQALYEQMVRLLEKGQSWFPPQMLELTFKLAKSAVNRKIPNILLQALTPREKEIALLIAEGHSNKNIADRVDISERTVKSHLTNIYGKLQLKDRVALVLYLK